MVDDVISPYPEDPWSLVPAEPDATSSSLFRALSALADPSRLTDTATTVTDPSAKDGGASGPREAPTVTSAFTLPPAPAATPFPTGDDGFLAPLKPLPRHEPDEAAGGSPGPGPGTGPESSGDPADAGRAGEDDPTRDRSTGLLPGSTGALHEDSGHVPGTEDREPSTGSPQSDREPSSAFPEGGRDREPSPAFPDGGRDHDRPAGGAAQGHGPAVLDEAHLSLPDGAGRERDLTDTGRALPTGEDLGRDLPGLPGLSAFPDAAVGSGRDRSGAVADSGPFTGGTDDLGRSRPGSATSGENRHATTGNDPGRDRLSPAGEPGRDHPAPEGNGSGASLPAGDAVPDRDRLTGDDRSPGRPAFGVGHDRDRSAFPAAEPAFPVTGAEPLRPFRPGSERPGPATERFERSEPAERGGRFEPVERGGPDRTEPLRVPESFGADPVKPAAPSERPASDVPQAASDASSGAFGSPSSAFGQDWDSPFLPPRDPSPSAGRTASFVPGPDNPLAADRGRPAERESDPAPDRPGAPDPARRPAPERDEAAASRRETPPSRRETSPAAPKRDAPEPAREPYQPRRRHSNPPPAFSAPSRHGSGTSRPSADSLDPESLLRGRRNAPSGGWRGLVYRASAGLIKPGESPEVRRRRELLGRARTPVATGHHRVAVLSLKGGVGKTTTTVGLGATLAQARGDRVIAVDANPDRGTLSDKVELETSATVRDLLNERQQIKRYVDIRAFTSQAPSRLEILASDRDPSVSEAFSASDYQLVAQVLENFYSICLTDCGTGLLHSAMSGVLGLADQLVLVSSPSVDGARAASATLDWLEAHHYEELVRSATVVLCSVRPRSKSTVDLDRLEAHFAARCRAVIRVPYDPHLEEGAEMELDRLQPATRESYLRLAASVGDGFAALSPDPQPLR
ncbi:hypothetical protein GCM10017673_08710 [Streptosporangium violaceochromogenes]|nr:hypothetical protein GCM10017673_08710 [Streptosporangium violaceochromogenes]